MTNLEIVQKLNVAFAEGCIEKIRHYVAKDVHLDVVGAITSIAKEAFNDTGGSRYFIGLPRILIKKEIEKEDHVAIEGEIKCSQSDGRMLDAFFFDIYRLEDGKINAMQSFIIHKKYDASKPANI
jgi:ketosteroid isomerase-like protein